MATHSTPSPPSPPGPETLAQVLCQEGAGELLEHTEYPESGMSSASGVTSQLGFTKEFDRNTVTRC